MDTEVTYLGHDNTIALALWKDNDSGVLTLLTNDEMDAITEITASFGSTKVSTLAANKATGAIRWSQTGFATGEIRLLLGDQSITADLYPKVPIIVYTASGDDGVIYAEVPISVKADPEGS